MAVECYRAGIGLTEAYQGGSHGGLARMARHQVKSIVMVVVAVIVDVSPLELVGSSDEEDGLAGRPPKSRRGKHCSGGNGRKRLVRDGWRCQQESGAGGA